MSTSAAGAVDDRFYRGARLALKLATVLLVLNYAAQRSCRTCGREDAAAEPSLAEALAQRVRVFCVILTDAGRHQHHAKHAHRTWARHCNRVLFVSDEEEGELEPVAFKHTDKWARLKEGLSYVHRYHRDEADWFLKAQDDNYVVLENLRLLLHRYSPALPIYFGCQLLDDHNQTYMYGESGYVLSKEALRRFVTLALPDAERCRAEPDGREDVEMGRCLRSVGVAPGDSRDANGSHTFFPFELYDYVEPQGLDADKYRWYFEHAPAAMEDGFVRGRRAAPVDRLSRHAIAFPLLPSSTMYDLEYFIYTMRLFGRTAARATLPPPLEFVERDARATDRRTDWEDRETREDREEREDREDLEDRGDREDREEHDDL